jgi:phospholipid/cholesterol/gamma-HCH transport system ATP-binding protein
MQAPLIEFKNVTKRFDTRTVLDGVSLKIYAGEVTTIIGKSGVGKSVLLKHIVGLLDADQGEVLLYGRPLNGLNRKERDELMGRVSYMFQNNALFDALTVYDNVAMPLQHTTRLGRQQIEAKVMERIAQTELQEVIHHYPAELSGGMKKRVALARALVTDPEIVLFDEPTTGQDPIRRNAILSMIAAYQRRLGFTAVLISHDLPDVFFISNRVIAVYEGQVIFEGTPEEFDEFDHPFRHEFVHSLENLQEELTGLYSRRNFKARYQTELQGNAQSRTYAVVVFRLEAFDAIQEGVGPTAAQELIRAVGASISQYFTDVGGFSTRIGVDRYTTVLPYSNLEEARQLVAGFADHFERKRRTIMQKMVKAEFDCPGAVSISIAAGVAEGQPDMNIEPILDAAHAVEDTILAFSAMCKGR